MDWLTDLINGIGDALSKSLIDLWNTISESIWDIFFKWIYQTVYDAVADLFTFMGSTGDGIFDLPWVNAYLKLFNLFGWALFLTGVIVAVFDIAIEYQSMHQLNIKRQMLPLLYGFFAVNLFSTLPIRLYMLSITIQNTLMHDLGGYFTDVQTLGENIPEIAYALLTKMMGVPNTLNLLFIGALGYCVIKVFFANIKRGGILLIQIAVGSLYLFSVPKGYTDGFIQWCKQIVALCLTAFLQMTLLYIGLLTWNSNMLLGLGVMLSANEVPRIAQMFGLDTSVKVNMSSAVHTTTTAINLTRAVAKK